ncbi:MAG: hypothetical protein Q3972_06745 [Corynebacterium sp.]|nr:hypothetical protein [Corynebacterium sp.]
MSYFLIATGLLIYPRPGDRLNLPAEKWVVRRWLILSPIILLIGLNMSTIVVLMGIGYIGWKAWLAYKDMADGQAARATLAEILGIFSGQLRAGNTNLQLETTGHPGVMAAIHMAATRASQGGNVEDVLAEVRVHPAVDEDLRRLGVMWGASIRYGIALATVIDHQRHVLDAYAQHQRTYKAQAQGALMSARVLLCLPLAGIALGSAMGAQPLNFLFGGGIGGIILIIGVGLAACGYWWSHKIIRKAMP